MSAVLQRVLIVMLGIFAVTIVLVWTVVPGSERGHLRAICEAISYGLFGVTLLCSVAIWQQRMKLAAISDPAEKAHLERKIIRGVVAVYLGLAASFPVGYLIGVQMLR